MGVDEAVIQARGRELLAAVEPERLVALTPQWWQERLMAWATADPEFRVKLLRFVDVLPGLRSSAAVADHVRQYFREGGPAAIRLGAAVSGAGAFRPVLSKVVRQGVFTMAERFIGGASAEEAVPRLNELLSHGTGYTVDLLGEAVLSGQEADVYLRRYLDLLETVPAGGGVAHTPNISIKLSALSAHFEAAAPEAVTAEVSGRLVPLLRRARELRVFVNVNMEQYRFKSLTHHVFEAVLGSEEFRDWEGVGIVVQAYLREAVADIDRLAELARRRGRAFTVRLVKGAYWDEETVLARQEGRLAPVFEDKGSTDESYERCTERLLAAHPDLRPAFGTHNPRSISQAMVRAEIAGLPRDGVEFQMLYGMAEGLRRAVQQQGYRARVYVPVGEIIPGMAYLVRRLLENTSNESWLVHRHEEGDPAEMLAAPVPAPPPRQLGPGFVNASPAQFYVPEVQARMRSALDARRRACGRHYPLLLGNDERETTARDEVRCPASPDVLIGTVARAGESDVDDAVGQARAAFPAWARLPARERAAVLRRAADVLEGRRFAFAATMVFESAKPWGEADGDVIEAIDYLRYYALQAEELGDNQRLVAVPGENGRLIHEPRGIAAIIAPWNFPLAIVCGMTTGALAAGCSAILKPAEQSPIVAWELVELLHEAGVPAGAVQWLAGPGEVVGRALVTHPGVDVIAFTGSNAVGLGIARAAAEVRTGQRNVKKVIAEMGGKNAVIVDEDADLDEAVSGVLASAFGFAGQKCSACSRVVVVGSAMGEFRARLAAAVEGLVVGPPDDPYTLVPPVISADAKARIEEYMDIGQREGRVVARGRVPTSDGYYVAPVVFEDIAPTSRLNCEEVFGPVLLLSGATDFETAVKAAMESTFALTGGVFSRNPRNIAFARREFRVGNLYINRKTTGAVVGRQPFGGYAMSGTGQKAGGPDYVKEFGVARVVTENTMRRGFAAD